MVKEARLILAEHGDEDKPVWVTELGWPACPCPPQEPPDPPIPNVSYEQQARYLVRSFVLAISAGAEVLLWYTFKDGSGSSEPSSENYFGLVQYDPDPSRDPGPEPKPVYQAYATMTSMLADHLYTADLAQQWCLPDHVHAFRFQSHAADRKVDVLWYAVEGEAHTVEIPAPGGAVEASDLYGLPVAVDELGGALAVSLTDAPIYLVHR